MATIPLKPESSSNTSLPFTGTVANDNTGSTIRESFTRINARLTEIYGAQNSSDVVQTPFVDTDNIKDANVTLAKIQDVSANTVLVRDANSTGVVSAKAVTDTQILIGDGTGFTAAALSSDVTMTNAGAVTIANDVVTHDKLENRYTAKATSTATGDQNLKALNATTFLLTGNVATATFTIQNMKLGQVIDIHMTGTLSSAAITLATDFTSATINKIGTNDFDTSVDNLIQVVCVDDTDSAAIINYAVGKITSDTTP